MSSPHSPHNHDEFACETVRRPPDWPTPASTVSADEHEDPYDACKESPIVDTLVEAAVVLLIAALINFTFWGIVRFGVPHPAISPGVVA